MPRERGLRERKRAQTRARLADAAAALFAEHGYDRVSVVDVARACEVSDQTVYNYFPAKQDLVLDRGQEFIDLYRQAVLDRRAGSSPASALSPLVDHDVERYRHADPHLARGQFPALCLQSPLLRRFALEYREHQTRAVAEALTTTNPGLEPLVAAAHAAALIAVAQTITDQIGASVLAGGPSPALAQEMSRAAGAAFADLDRSFLTVTTAHPGGTS